MFSDFEIPHVDQGMAMLFFSSDNFSVHKYFPTYQGPSVHVDQHLFGKI